MKRNKIKFGPVLMVITILCIAVFQFYWLRENYVREKRTLTMKAEMLFRETVMKLQVSRLKLDGINFDTSKKGRIRVKAGHDENSNRFQFTPKDEIVTSINVLRDKLADSILKDTSGKKGTMMITMNTSSSLTTEGDSMKFNMEMHGPPPPMDNHIFSFLYGVDSLQEPIRITEIDSAYSLALQKQKLAIPFSIVLKDSSEHTDGSRFNAVTIGLAHPVTYKLELGNVFSYLIKRITQPILFSILLLGITILSFVLLYKNLLKQQRLAALKNEFISNVTHELKTPIATVGVAIEALKNFNAIHNPEKTKEYLDISSNELHRLNLLVDKVLKLSMFEKQEMELKKEPVNLEEVIQEVTDSLKLQFEKHRAKLSVTHSGDTVLQGDRLHLLSVVYNLLDNALKYSKGDPAIQVDIKGDDKLVVLTVADNGIGIAPEYKSKIFEKFFRIPHGDTHNAKGYGLGLSYVAQVIKKHNGTLVVESQPGTGTVFTISIPKQTA